MKPFRALVRKQVHESRWTLLITASVLFGLGWLFVYITSLNEARIVRALSSADADGRIQWMRRLGVASEPDSVEIMMAFWNHPLLLILVSTWGIVRGSAAVAAEVERGTMDLILSRPVSRTSYLASQVAVAMVGLAVLALALFAGAAMGVRYNVLRIPPGVSVLLRPAANLAALGVPIYGYTLLASSLDHVRWRPAGIGSGLTLAGFIAYVIAMIPVFAEMWWKPWLERVSIFRAYSPVELVTRGETFLPHLGFLAAVGAPCIALAFVAFAVRDLPANG